MRVNGELTSLHGANGAVLSRHGRSGHVKAVFTPLTDGAGLVVSRCGQPHPVNRWQTDAQRGLNLAPGMASRTCSDRSN